MLGENNRWSVHPSHPGTTSAEPYAIVPRVVEDSPIIFTRGPKQGINGSGVNSYIVSAKVWSAGAEGG